MNLTIGIFLTYTLLALAMLSLWRNPIQVTARRTMFPWAAFTAGACISGLVAGVVRWPGILALLGFACLAYVTRERERGAIRTALLWATGLMALAISLHKLPGFANPSIGYSAIVYGKAVPTAYNLNFDKIAAGIILFAFFCEPARNRSEWRQVFRHYPIILGVPVLVLAAGVASGFIRFDPKFFAYIPVLAFCNLLFTCVPEEAFFRGFLQRHIAEAIKRKPYGDYIALILVPLLFGIAHIKGGVILAGLATLAGLGYGYAYYRSRRIEAAILAHIVLNAMNFVIFSPTSTS